MPNERPDTTDGHASTRKGVFDGFGTKIVGAGEGAQGPAQVDKHMSSCNAHCVAVHGNFRYELDRQRDKDHSIAPVILFYCEPAGMGL